MPDDPSTYTRIRNQMLQSALISPQSASIFFVALIAFALDLSLLGLPSVAWLILGVVGVIAFTIATMGDVGATEALLDQMARSEFNPAEIKNMRARQRVQQALEYVHNIRTIGQQRGGAMRVQLGNTSNELNEWVSQIYKIARRIDLYEENTLLNRDLARVPNELKRLQQRLADETDAGLRQELQEAIALREKQLSSLQSLEGNMKRADLQLDNTVAALGTIFAQVQLLDSRDVDSRRSERLRQSIRDEVSSLQDTIEAIDEVHQARFLAQ